MLSWEIQDRQWLFYGKGGCNRDQDRSSGSSSGREVVVVVKELGVDICIM